MAPSAGTPVGGYLTQDLFALTYYAAVADIAQNFYSQGDAALRVGLMLFDQERMHIDAGWEWALANGGNTEADALLLHYANATAHVGDLRYDRRRIRIPQLEAAVAAAQRLQDRGGEGAALGNLGVAYAALGEARTAIDFFEQWRVIAREIGDRHGEGQALGNLGIAYANLGDARKAIDFFGQYLLVAREIGDRRGEGQALGNLGMVCGSLGEARTAIDFFEQHLAVAREISDQHSEGIALANLGLAYAMLGDARQAITFYEQRLAIARELGNRGGGAITSWNLGLALEQEGELARAAEMMQVRVDYEWEVGHPDAEGHAILVEQLRQRLAASQAPPPAENLDGG